MGSALLWSPFYAVADAVVRARRAMGDRDRGGWIFAAVRVGGRVRIGGVRVAVAAAVDDDRCGCSAIAQRPALEAHAVALIAAIAVWIGTPLFFYMYIAPPMSHACSAFAVGAVRAGRGCACGNGGRCAA